MKKIELWENPPYLKDSNNFYPSVTEYKVNDSKSTVIVCPGGGYCLKADYEGGPIAEMFNNHNINAFVLDYNVSPCNKFAPLSDIQRAIRTARSMGYERVAVCGFSAGGHLACTSATLYDYPAYEKQDKIDELSSRPDAFLPCYPVVSFDESFAHIGSRKALLGTEWEDESLVKLFSNELNVSCDTPPCFIWHTANDDVVPVKNSLELAYALTKNNIYYEMHIFPNGCHGLALAYDKNDVGIWSDCACTFLKNLGF